jgi:antitoxin MazE
MHKLKISSGVRPMQVGKWRNSLAVRLPASIVELLDLKQGDDIEIRISGDRTLTVDRDGRRAEIIARLKALNLTLPPGFKFDRDEADKR